MQYSLRYQSLFSVLIMLLLVVSSAFAQKVPCEDSKHTGHVNIEGLQPIAQANPLIPLVNNGYDKDWYVYMVDSVGFITMTHLRIDLDSQDNPHFVYTMTQGKNDKWCVYTYLDEAQQEFSINYVYSEEIEPSIDMVLDDLDNPHFTYHNHEREGEQDNPVHLYRDSGGQWIDENIFTPGHDGWSTSIALDSNGYPHISWIDPDCCEGDSGGVEYGFFDGTDWTVEETGGESDLWIFHGTSLSLDSEDTPHISYYDAVAQDMMLAVRKSGSWTLETVDATGDVGRFSSMHIDDNDDIHIAYYMHLQDSSGVIKYAKSSSASWDITALDTLHHFDTDDGQSNRIPDVTTVTMDLQGNVLVSYADLKQMKVAHFNGSTWDIETVVDHRNSARITKQQAAMKVDALGLPHIAFEELEYAKTGTPTLNQGLYAVKKPYGFDIAAVPVGGNPIHAGDTLKIQYVFNNFTLLAQPATVWVNMIMPNGNEISILNPRTLNMTPKQSREKVNTFILPANASSGQYSLVAYIGESASDTMSTDTVNFSIVDMAGFATAGTTAEIDIIPNETTLNANYPNPFNPSTVISLNLAEDSQVSLTVFDVNGRVVKRLVNAQSLGANSYQFIWNGTDDAGQQVGSGVYFYRLETSSGYVKTRKMLLTR